VNEFFPIYLTLPTALGPGVPQPLTEMSTTSRKITFLGRKLHNEELHDLYSSPSIIAIIKARRMRWAGHVARMGEKRNTYRLLVGKPE
jgi:hypothetical protein